MCDRGGREDHLDGGGTQPHAAHDGPARHHATGIDALVGHLAIKPVSVLAPVLVVAAVLANTPVQAQSAAAEGKKLALDRGKGNCLTCHEIKGGDLPGSIGPELKDIKSKYPERKDLIAIVTDET